VRCDDVFGNGCDLTTAYDRMTTAAADHRRRTASEIDVLGAIAVRIRMAQPVR
jgi:hypothetical protein